jgi:hypothetical protein
MRPGPCSVYKFPKLLRQDVRSFYAGHFKRAFFAPEVIMQDIPSSLQRQARYYMHRDMLVKIRLLAGAPVHLIDNLMRRVSRVRLQAGHCAALEPQTAIFMEKGSMEFEPEGVLLSEGDCWMPRQQQSSELPGPPAVADPKGCRGLSTEVCYSFARIHEVEAVLKVRTLRAPAFARPLPSFDAPFDAPFLRSSGSDVAAALLWAPLHHVDTLPRRSQEHKTFRARFDLRRGYVRDRRESLEGTRTAADIFSRMVRKKSSAADKLPPDEEDRDAKDLPARLKSGLAHGVGGAVHAGGCVMQGIEDTAKGLQAKESALNEDFALDLVEFKQATQIGAGPTGEADLALGTNLQKMYRSMSRKQLSLGQGLSDGAPSPAESGGGGGGGGGCGGGGGGLGVVAEEEGAASGRRQQPPHTNAAVVGELKAKLQAVTARRVAEAEERLCRKADDVFLEAAVDLEAVIGDAFRRLQAGALNAALGAPASAGSSAAVARTQQQQAGQVAFQRTNTAAVLCLVQEDADANSAASPAAATAATPPKASPPRGGSSPAGGTPIKRRPPSPSAIFV